MSRSTAICKEPINLCRVPGSRVVTGCPEKRKSSDPAPDDDWRNGFVGRASGGALLQGSSC